MMMMWLFKGGGRLRCLVSEVDEKFIFEKMGMDPRYEVSLRFEAHVQDNSARPRYVSS